MQSRLETFLTGPARVHSPTCQHKVVSLREVSTVVAALRICQMPTVSVAVAGEVASLRVTERPETSLTGLARARSHQLQVDHQCVTAAG